MLRIGPADLSWVSCRRGLVPTGKLLSVIRKLGLCRTLTTLGRWARSDGTVFYVARTGGEHDQKVRAALTGHVWSLADGKDALYEDCVGPSAYWKAQGTPVRVWGLLANGVLFITVLPEVDVMNCWWYEWVIERRFCRWLADAFGKHHPDVFVAQDHERAL